VGGENVTSSDVKRVRELFTQFSPKDNAVDGDALSKAISVWDDEQNLSEGMFGAGLTMPELRYTFEQLIEIGIPLGVCCCRLICRVADERCPYQAYMKFYCIVCQVFNFLMLAKHGRRRKKASPARMRPSAAVATRTRTNLKSRQTGVVFHSYPDPRYIESG
jgi:hypothetical protein